ncbi:MAG: AraC family transcriptional regulator [Desulfobacteraceae bacterium]|nr:MAG: AraC family transcriptional regulator [Desulfobacteraceae bacterium]
MTSISESDDNHHRFQALKTLGEVIPSGFWTCLKTFTGELCLAVINGMGTRMDLPSKNRQTLEAYQQRINRVMNYVSQNLDRALTLEDLAGQAAFSRFHFHRIFHALTGETLNQFISRLRLQKASHLLTWSTRKSITEIGFECGFSSSQNFARSFKRQFGITPSAFRRDSGMTQHPRHQWPPEPAPWSLPDAKQQIEITIKDLSGYRVIYARLIGDYDPLKIGPLFKRFISAADAGGLITPETHVLGLSWDNTETTPLGKLRYDACLSMPVGKAPPDHMDRQEIRGGRYAVYHTIVKNLDFKTPWQALLKDWLPGSGFQPGDQPCYERYYNNGFQHPEGHWEVDLCLPIKPL